MSDALEFRLTLYPSPVLRKRTKPGTGLRPKPQGHRRSHVPAHVRKQRRGPGRPPGGLGSTHLVLNEKADPDEPERNLTLINPTITGPRRGPRSVRRRLPVFPGRLRGNRTPARCTVEAFDVEGNPVRAEYDGFQSRIIQHEYDHLEGILLVDRLSPADKLRNKATLLDLVERYKAEQA